MRHREKKSLTQFTILFFISSSLPLSPPSSDSPTVYSLRLSESNFYNNNTGRRATLPEMLHVLDNVTDILIPGSFDQVWATSSLLSCKACVACTHSEVAII